MRWKFLFFPFASPVFFFLRTRIAPPRPAGAKKSPIMYTVSQKQQPISRELKKISKIWSLEMLAPSRAVECRVKTWVRWGTAQWFKRGNWSSIITFNWIKQEIKIISKNPSLKICATTWSCQNRRVFTRAVKIFQWFRNESYSELPRFFEKSSKYSSVPGAEKCGKRELFFPLLRTLLAPVVLSGGPVGTPEINWPS
jgi:hypothetical protein